MGATSRKAGSSEAPELAGGREPELSALSEAVARVGDRWTLLLIDALMEGPRRFGELAEDLAGIAPNILSQRLRHLEREALVIARPYSERPPRFVYELTVAGRELAGALLLLREWGARHSDEAESPRHGACGTPMEVRWYCPTCESAVDDADAADVHFV